jgi:hypothetical protein
VRRGASWTAASYVQLTVAAVARPVRRSVVPSQPMLLSCPGLSPAQTASPRGASSRHPAVGRRRRGRHCQDASHGVGRRSVSTMRCPLTRCRRPGSGSPAVQCPARPVSGHLGLSSRVWRSGRLVSTRPASSSLVSSRPMSSRPVSSPSGVRPVGPDASVSSHSGRWRWGAGRCSGAPVTTGTGRGPGGLPRRRAARSTASRPGGRAALPRSRGG